jgi:signal transduction histidine kinase
MDQVSFPNFRVCQLVLGQDGIIKAASANAADKLCSPEKDIVGKNLRTVLLSIESTWAKILPESFSAAPEEIFLPWEDTSNKYAAGLSLHILRLGDAINVTATPGLLPDDRMQQASLQELPHDPGTVGQLFLRLRTAESRLNNYLHNFPGIFFSQRPDFSFSYIGPGLSELLGIDQRPLLRNGNKFLELILDADQPQFLKEIEQSSISSESISITYRVRNPATKSIIYILDVRTPRLSPGGLLLGYEGVWLDITRQSIAEARLSRSAWKENLATITSGLIHDFSNVMAGIFSLSELYNSSLEPEHPWKKGMTQIMESSRQARKLVRRIIDLNREVAGTKNYFNLENLISDQLDLIKAVVSRQTKIETDLTGEELPVYLDDVSFRQTILNLAINSRDAIEHGGVIRIKVRKTAEGESMFPDTPNMTAPAPHEGAVVEFSDNGCGIPQEFINRIWEPFFTTKEASKGSGFGLYNAKLFIAQSKGRIAVKSEIGKGTTFYIYLPLADFNETVELDEDEQKLVDDHKRRRTIAVLCSTDPSGFDVVQRMREKEWELIFFKRPEALRRYLREAPRCPDMMLTMILGADAVDANLTKELRETHHEMALALVTSGRSLDEIPTSDIAGIDLSLEDHGAPDEVVQQLDAFLHNIVERVSPL